MEKFGFKATGLILLLLGYFVGLSFEPKVVISSPEEIQKILTLQQIKKEFRSLKLNQWNSWSRAGNLKDECRVLNNYTAFAGLNDLANSVDPTSAIAIDVATATNDLYKEVRKRIYPMLGGGPICSDPSSPEYPGYVLDSAIIEELFGVQVPGRSQYDQLVRMAYRNAVTLELRALVAGLKDSPKDEHLMDYIEKLKEHARRVWQFRSDEIETS